MSVQLAADSLRKASQHKPLGTKALWGTEGLQLPAYIQHIAHALIRERGMSKGHAIATAKSRCDLWAGGGGNVDEKTRTAARKAITEWNAARAKARATPNKSSAGGSRRARGGGTVTASSPLSAHREVLMATTPTKNSPPAAGGANTKGGAGRGSGGPPKNSGSGPPSNGAKPIKTVADVRDAVASIKKLPPPMQPKAAKRVVAAARSIDGAMTYIPSGWTGGSSSGDQKKPGSKG